MKFSKTKHNHAINTYGVSKKSILIIVTVVFSFLNLSATTLSTAPGTTIRTTITSDDLVEVFDWTVKTTTGDFSGTASTLFNAKRRTNIIGKGVVVLEQRISTYYVLKSEMKSKNNRVYFWEVKSEHGYAKGFSKEAFTAKRMIHLVAKGDILSYRIILSMN